MSNPTSPDKMIMTVLEAHVASEKWDALSRTFAEASKNLPSQMVQTFLVQSTDDPTLWRGISIWRSRQALSEYRRSVETPGGILMFRSVGAEPTLSMFDVAVGAQAAH